MNAESSSTGTTQQRALASWQGRLAALFEVTGVYIVGVLLGAIIGRLIGMQNFGALLKAASADPQPDFSLLAWVAAQNLILQYVCLLGIAFLIGWWHRKRRLAAYGLTTAEHSLPYHVVAGIVLFAVASLPVVVLFLVNKYYPLGPGADHWVLLQREWTPAFWLFMAVGSYGLVPVVEELFFRGYLQTRLTEDFGPLAAILITAVTFALSHGQYRKLSVLAIGMLVTILIEAICIGYVFYRTKSLLAPIICHAIGNIPNSLLLPTRRLADFLIPLLMLVVVYLFRKQIAAYLRQLYQALIAIPAPRVTSAALLYVVLLIIGFELLPLVLAVVGIVTLTIALLFEYKEKRTRRLAPAP